MATGGLDPLTELCEDLLNCEVCKEDFDYDTRTPRILPCFHSFCETCLKRLAEDGKCRCPMCQDVIPVTQRFPMDTTRMKVMDKKRALQSQGGFHCGGCIEDAKATSLCQDCEEFLCDECCTAHRKMKVFKNHTVVSLSEALRNPDELLKSFEKCDRHPDEKLKLFCVTCNTAACSTCAHTTHKKCEDLVDMASILDDKKKEMLALCDELDEVQQSFQAKAEESEASVVAVESNLNEAVHKVEGLLAEVIKSAIARQEEAISELRAQAKVDKLQLGDQASTFRSLQAAAQTAAQYGRRCVALSLASQVFCQPPQLKKNIQELRKKTTAHVLPAPEYKVSAGKMAELQALLTEMGRVESTTLLKIRIGDQIVALPSIKLDASRCGTGCRVGEDSCSLSNQPSTHDHSQPQSQRFRFRGTCGSEALPGMMSYWQVRCVATAQPEIKEIKMFCEFGVATQEALQACPGGENLIADTSHCALTVWTCNDWGYLSAVPVYRKRMLGDFGVDSTRFSPASPRSPNQATLGLLLDTATARLHIIDVMNKFVPCSVDIDLSTPVWPVVRVWREKYNGARVEVEVQSGQQIEFSEDLIKLLQSVL